MDDQPRNRGRLVVGQVPVHRAVEVTNRHGTFNDQGSIKLLAQAVGEHIMFVFNVADDLFNDILERDQPKHHAIFVHHQRRVGLAAQKRLQLVLQCRRFRNEPGLERDIRRLHLAAVAARRGVGAEQVLCVQHADDVVGIASPERHPRVGRGQHLANKIVCRQFGVERAHLGPVNHGVADRYLGKHQQTAKHVAFGTLDLPFPVQDIDRALELFRPAHALLSFDQRNTKNAQHQPYKTVDGGDNRPEYRDKERHKRRNQQGDAVGIGDRDRLGSHLSENHNERGHDNRRVKHPVFSDGGDKLKVRGVLGLSLFGRTQTWRRSQ